MGTWQGTLCHPSGTRDLEAAVATFLEQLLHLIVFINVRPSLVKSQHLINVHHTFNPLFTKSVSSNKIRKTILAESVLQPPKAEDKKGGESQHLPIFCSVKPLNTVPHRSVIIIIIILLFLTHFFLFSGLSPCICTVSAV